MILIRRLSGAALAVFATALLLSGCAVQRPVPEAPRPAPAPIVTPSPSFGGDSTYIVQRGDSLSGVARKFGVPARAVIDANGLRPPFTLQIGQRLTLPQQKTHTVEPGETLFGISRRYGVDSSVLVQLNKLEPPYAIRSGMVLNLPAPPAPEVTASAMPAGIPQRSGSVQTESLPAAPIAVAPVTSPALVSPTPVEQPPAASSVPVPSASAAAVAPAAATPVAGSPPSPAPATPAIPQAAPSPVSAPASVEPPPAPTVVPPSAPPEATVEPPRAAEPQRTAVVPPRAPPPRAGRTFQWPVKGRVVATFGPQGRGLHNDGLNIAAPRGTPIRAAENGEVAYDGDGIKALGNLLLIRHADGFMTAYAHAETLLVKKGDIVRRGQVIARVGDSGGVSEPQLHFEIRQGAQAIDPQPLMGSPAGS
jgi:murein DD-endopeptidase MepM/ murein hydrolase activator NlpD